MKHVLLIEDEAGIARMISVQLHLVGFEVHVAPDVASALEVDLQKVDLIILDWMLPDGEGPDVIPKIRQETRAPILMLTARSELVDKLTGFEAGADDYLTKPFDMMELIARIKALLRRTGATPQAGKSETLSYGAIRMDLDSRSVQVNGTPIDLTPTEFKILENMLRCPGKVFSRDELIELVMGYEYEGYGRTLDSHIARLRSKIEPEGKSRQYIKTVFGVGYKFGEEQ